MQMTNDLLFVPSITSPFGLEVRLKWVVTYTKLYRTGPLEGFQVDRTISFPNEELAKGFCRYCKNNPYGSERFTDDLYTVTRCSYLGKIY